MRVFDNGCFYTVTVSENEVSDFADRWPCFGECRAIWFQFDKRNSDLVDMGNDAGMDGAGVVALSHDAQAYGRKRLKLAA